MPGWTVAFPIGPHSVSEETSRLRSAGAIRSNAKVVTLLAEREQVPVAPVLSEGSSPTATR